MTFRAAYIMHARPVVLARQKEKRRDVELEDKGGIVTGHQNSFELFH